MKQTTQSAVGRRWPWCVVVGGAVVAAGLVAAAVVVRRDRPADPDPPMPVKIDRLVEAEELILALTPRLKSMAKGLMNLRVPGDDAADLFAPRVEVLGLAAEPAEEQPSVLGTIQRDWPLAAEPHSVDRGELALFAPLVERARYFEHAKVYFVAGEFLDENRQLFEAEMGLAAALRLDNGRLCSVSGEQRVRWRKEPALTPGREPVWRIVGWHQKKLKTLERDAPVFHESLDESVPDAAVRERARESIHERLIVQSVQDPAFVPPTKHFFIHSHDRHPGLAVVDIDGDGYDDLYLCDQWGRNLLLRNRGDGTFEEQAARWGLDFSDHCSSAVFADFDNDGDADVFIGRTLERSLYLVNDAGRYVDRTAELCGLPLPALVSSLSVVDFNRDGLLDVYFSTYAAQMVESELLDDETDAATRPASGLLLAEFLSEADAREAFRRAAHSERFTARVGPPNVLLMNVGGGRFELAPAWDQLAGWRNTYQSTWADFDGDGHPDVYLANDFSENNLLRNNGDGTFSDVTGQMRAADVGFGMGAAWGDFDNDSHQDLYVSNMFSKAGRRITGQLEGAVDPRFARMARGNTLFRNPGPGEPFEQVSGLDANSLEVEKAGWSWGSQFLDVDNDGYLDIVALSGYYSAPKEIEVDVDL